MGIKIDHWFIMKLLKIKEILLFFKKEKPLKIILSKKELRKIKHKKYSNEYYKKNKAIILSKRKTESNKIRIKEYQKKYYQKTRNIRLSYQDDYRKNNHKKLDNDIEQKMKAVKIKDD